MNLNIIDLNPVTIKVKNCLEANQFIDEDRCNNKNRHPCHDLPQACGGSKYVCLVWITTTDNLLTHPRTGFSINGFLSNPEVA